MSEDIKVILGRIKKLLAHAKSAKEIGSIVEAEAFMAKVQELLDVHKLGMDEVAFQEREEAEPIGWEHVGSTDEGFEFRGKRIKWQIQIAAGIAKANECRLVTSDGNSLNFVGRTSNREICKIIFLYLLDLCRHLNDLSADQEREYQRFVYHNEMSSWEKPSEAGFRHHMKRFRAGWNYGFAGAVADRFYKQAAVAHATAKQVNPAALIYIRKDELAVDQFLKGKIHSTPGMQGRPRNMDGYNRGKAVGGSVALTPNRFEGAKGRAGRLLSAAC